ncbi:Uracil-DNA glycosylase, family 4 [hydrothermal vent metagenome]|uniref:Type-4 uracil-DNA glycosylase n=1 Tax=hydrothermal vent metagenome TaxID=652676 RepID=A0A3B1B553_9ZZZZ
MGIDVWVRKNVPEMESFVQDATPAVVEIATSQAVVMAETEAPLNHPATPDNDVLTLDWAALQTRVAQCDLCELHKTRTQTVFGTGSHHADWLIIGEAPDVPEDSQGEAFVGAGGQLLNAMLRALDLKREDVYITNSLKCCSQNRAITESEVRCCSSYLQRQIQLLQPKIILILGSTAAQHVLQTNTTLGRLRGRVHHFDYSPVPVIVSYHPAYLLSSPLEKRNSWEDLLFAKSMLVSGD